MRASTIGILGADWGYTIVTFAMIHLIAFYIRMYSGDLSFWYNLFKRIKIKNKMINLISRGRFTVYVLHAAVIPYLMISTEVVNGNIFFVHLMIKTVAIFVICINRKKII